MNLDFLQLEYYLEICNTLNLTAAAQKLYISQQTLSLLLTRMEKGFGAKLFERTRPLTLTPAGKRFQARAESILFMHRQLLKEMDDYSVVNKPTLTIGTSQAYAHTLLPSILSSYILDNPRVKVTLHEDNFNNLEEMLIKGSIDITIGHLPSPNPNLRSLLIREDPYCVYAPHPTLEKYLGLEGAKFARRQLLESSDLRSIERCPFILTRYGHVRNYAIDIITAAKISPHIILEAANLETALAFCAEGLGITFAPSFLVYAYPSSETADDDLYPYEDLGYTIYTSYSAKGYLSATMKDFLRLLL
jgi:DNA-binding transcriptional LysR family regulator